MLPSPLDSTERSAVSVADTPRTAPNTVDETAWGDAQRPPNVGECCPRLFLSQRRLRRAQCTPPRKPVVLAEALRKGTREFFIAFFYCCPAMQREHVVDAPHQLAMSLGGVLVVCPIVNQHCPLTHKTPELCQAQHEVEILRLPDSRMKASGLLKRGAANQQVWQDDSRVTPRDRKASINVALLSFGKHETVAIDGPHAAERSNRVRPRLEELNLPLESCVQPPIIVVEKREVLPSGLCNTRVARDADPQGWLVNHARSGNCFGRPQDCGGIRSTVVNDNELPVQI